MRRFSLAALSLLLAATLPLGAQTQLCPLPGGGAIAGQVTSEAGGAPLAGARVVAARLVDGFPTEIADTTTGPTGHYQLAQLAAGDYFVYTAGTELLVDEVWPGPACDQICSPHESGTAVTLASGAFVEDIDFALAEGGRIEGFVRAADGITPAPGALVQVSALSPAPGVIDIGEVTAGLDGGWAIEGLQGVSYKLRALAAGLVAEVYPDSTCPFGCALLGTGDPVAVTEGATTSGIDFALAAGATLSGTVTDLAATPIVGTIVLVYASDGFRSMGDSTDANGAWSAREGLPPGTYYARTAGDHVDELWDDLPCEPFCTITSGTPIVVSNSDPVTGLDFELERLGAITGTVVESGSGAPLGGVTVVARAGEQPAIATTAADGTFAIGGLAPGSYLVTAADGSHVGEIYDDAGICYDVVQCFAPEPTLVEVVGTATTTGIDFTLAPGGALAGTVVAAASQAPVAFASIEVFRLDGTGEFTLVSDVDGRFGIGSMPAGVSYRVLARPQSGTALLGEVWEEQACNALTCSPDGGTPVPVTAGETACVTFTLNGDAAGATAITGQVTDEDGPLQGAQVSIYDAAGVFLGNVLTDESGVYLTAGALALAPGTYYVVASAFQHLSELYDDLPCSGCDPTTGTPVVAIEGATVEGIDFELPFTGLGLPLIYLEDCKPDGCVYYAGLEDSRINRSSIMGHSTAFLPEFPLPADFWNELVACVRHAYRPFGVEVTDVDPGTQPHLEHVIAGESGQLGLDPHGVAGVSPFSCGFIPNSISFTFAGELGDTPSTTLLHLMCWVAVQEIGHQHGLDHHAYMPDAMTYIEGCEPKTLPRLDVPCGEVSPRACVCGGTTENSYERLLAIHGSSGVLFGDGFEILEPGQSCVWSEREPPQEPLDLLVDRLDQRARVAPELQLCGTFDPRNPGLRISPQR